MSKIVRRVSRYLPLLRGGEYRRLLPNTSRSGDEIQRLQLSNTSKSGDSPSSVEPNKSVEREKEPKLIPESRKEETHLPPPPPVERRQDILVTEFDIEPPNPVLETISARRGFEVVPPDIFPSEEDKVNRKRERKHLVRAREKLRDWVTKHAWVREDLEWKTKTPVLSEKKAHLTCKVCKSAKRKTLWWRDKVLEDKVLEDKVLEDKVLEDKVLEDKVLEDKVLEDKVLEDKVLQDEVLQDEVLQDIYTCHKCFAVLGDHKVLPEGLDDELLKPGGVLPTTPPLGIPLATKDRTTNASAVTITFKNFIELVPSSARQGPKNARAGKIPRILQQKGKSKKASRAGKAL